MKHEICAEADLAVGQQIALEAGGVKLLLFHLEDGFYATQSSCTHLFMPLKKGKIIDGCKVQCPFHRAHFDIRSGEVAKWADFPPRYPIDQYHAQEKGAADLPCHSN